MSGTKKQATKVNKSSSNVIENEESDTEEEQVYVKSTSKQSKLQGTRKGAAAAIQGDDDEQERVISKSPVVANKKSSKTSPSKETSPLQETKNEKRGRKPNRKTELSPNTLNKLSKSTKTVDKENIEEYRGVVEHLREKAEEDEIEQSINEILVKLPDDKSKEKVQVSKVVALVKRHLGVYQSANIYKYIREKFREQIPEVKSGGKDSIVGYTTKIQGVKLNPEDFVRANQSTGAIYFKLEPLFKELLEKFIKPYELRIEDLERENAVMKESIDEHKRMLSNKTKK
jgi:hypothetical protein